MKDNKIVNFLPYIAVKIKKCKTENREDKLNEQYAYLSRVEDIEELLGHFIFTNRSAKIFNIAKLAEVEITFLHKSFNSFVVLFSLKAKTEPMRAKRKGEYS